MRRLIINADDLGMSHEVNQQIEECINQGCITSSTLMANAPAFDEGVRIAKQYPHISIGVHLNLIEYAPLTNSDVFKKYGIVGENGCFIEGAIFSVPIEEALKKAIYEEWDAQISKIEMMGLSPTHCDSHEHTHTIIDLQEVLCQVMDKHHIKSVRRKVIPSIRLMLRAKRQVETIQIGKNEEIQPKKRNVIYRRIHLFVVKYQSWRWNNNLAKKYSMTNSFSSFRDFYLNRDILHLGGENSAIELMCHPGNKLFDSETKCLMNDKSWFNDSYKLIPYHQLKSE